MHSLLGGCSYQWSMGALAVGWLQLPVERGCTRCRVAAATSGAWVHSLSGGCSYQWSVGALAVGWLQLRGAFLVLYVDAAVSLPFPLRADTTGAVGCELVAVCVDTHLSLYKDCMNIRICMCEGITYIGLLMRLGVHT